jgi:hypothetical protein
VGGFSPRLYRVTLNDSVRAWLFRWSGPPYLRNFVGSQPGVCEQPDRFLEIVAQERLREILGTSDGDVVTVYFGWEAGELARAEEIGGFARKMDE